MRTYGIALFHRNGHEAGTGSGGGDGLRRQGRAPDSPGSSTRIPDSVSVQRIVITDGSNRLT